MFDIPTLLPPNHTRVELALEAALRAHAPDLDPIAKLMNPDTCPIDLLPWLAWVFSVDVWEDRWSENVKRDVIRTSIEVHKIKGTLKAVQRALRSVGFSTDITEWFEREKRGGQFGAPHTFSVDAYAADVYEAGFQVNATLVALIDRILENVKPVRSHFKVSIGEQFDFPVPVRSGVSIKSVSKLEHDFQSPTIQIGSSIAMRTGVAVKSTSQMVHQFEIGEAF